MGEVEGSTAGVRNILGIRVTDLSYVAAIARVNRAIERSEHAKIAFCNAHTANTACAESAYRQVLQSFTVFPDGVGVDVAARWLGGAPFQANLNGTDFVPELLRSAARPFRIGLIGGRPGVAERAAEALSKLGPGHQIALVLDGFSDGAAESRFLGQLADAPVDVLLVAMGNPRQEYWISSRIDSRHAIVAIGVGALFDFLAGEVVRAPALLRQMRLEWLWRLMLEPKRLFRRYVVGNPLFLARVALARMGVRQER